MRRCALPTAGIITYLIAICILAKQKPLWFDELFTWHLSQVATYRQLWNALTQGFDPNPPLGYLLTRASLSTVPTEPATARLPAMVGFGLLLMPVAIGEVIRTLSRRVLVLGPVRGPLTPLIDLTNAGRIAIPAHEMVATAGMAALPILGVLLGKVATGVYVERYGLPTVAGLSLVGSFAACRLAGGCSVRGSLLVSAFLMWIVAAWCFALRGEMDQCQRIEASCVRLEKECPGTGPIVGSDPHRFLQLARYAPVKVACRLCYLSNRSQSFRLLGSDNNENALEGLSRITNPSVHDYQSFLAQRQSFCVLGGDHWLTTALESDGVTLQVVEPAPDSFLFLASQESAQVRPAKAPIVDLPELCRGSLAMWPF
jgi:hypothetical protein